MHKSTIIEIASQINSLYIQKGFIESGDYTVTLLFLHIYRDEVVFNKINLDEAAEITLSGNLSSKELIEIRSFFQVLDFFTKEDLIEVFQGFSKLDQDEIKNNFSYVFEKFFNYLTGLVDYKNGAFVVHRNMLDLILKVAKIDQIKNVYNPFASNATIGTLLDNSIMYYGQEYNNRVWRIGKLRLLAYNRKESYSLESSIDNWSNEKFDLIFSRLPFINKIKVAGFENIDLENFIINQSIKSIKKEGKIILLMRSSFLTSQSSSNFELFKNLVDNNFIEKILFFPVGSFRHSGISCSVVVLNTHKVDRNIDLIDFTDYLENHKSRKGIVDWDSFNTPNYLFEPWESVKVSTEKIAANNYYLNIHSYFLEEIFSGKKLGEYVDVYTGHKVDSNNYPEYIVKVKNLNDYQSNQELSLEKLDSNNVANIASNRVINQRGVLISSIGSRLKPTYFDGSTPILVSNSIYLLRIKNVSELSIRFLIYTLSSDEVKKQIDAFSSSTSVLKKISVSDLKNIIVDIPSRSKQIEILDEIYTSIVCEPSVEYLSEKKKIIEANAVEISEANAILRHKIAGPLSNLIFYAENIQQILEKEASKEIPHILDLKLNNKQLFNLGELLNKLLSDSKFITNEVRNQTKELNVFEYPLKEIDIVQWLENYANTEKEKHPEVLITFDVEFDTINKLKVTVNEDLLIILFDNLFRNIYKHAFTSNFDGNRRIEVLITIDSEDQLMNIFLSNTGKPFPENFTMDDYGRKGIKSGKNAGNGIGGYFVKSIINYFNGEWYITDETGSEGLPDTDLATTFEISLPYTL